ERSLAACEGAILLIDAVAGIQAQTLSHWEKAKKLGLKIIPVINKIDLPNANPAEILEMFPDALLISAKTGEGIKELLEKVIQKIPPPAGDPDVPVKTLIFSSSYDPQRGVIAFVKVLAGILKNNVGHFTPAMTPTDFLETGEVGYLLTGLKDPEKIKLWAGYHQPQSNVFVSLFPVDQDDLPAGKAGFSFLEDALKKLKLNDAALNFQLTSSKALGRGFRCGFLGHLHGEITQERLEKDFNLSVLATMPVVEYRIKNYELSNQEKDHNSSLEEPWIKATIITPKDYVGGIINLCEDRRGKLLDLNYRGGKATLLYELPLAEIITDFFDKLKSLSSGFASFDYEPCGYRAFTAVQLDILINHETIDAFSQIMEQSKALGYGKNLVAKLTQIIPRQQIPIPIQAVIDGQIVARSDIPAFRKDVTAKLYGGDVTRRMKLLEKQKRGKEKMKSIGRVQIPNDTFLKVFKT
ncbi:elongation factor 4, partial [Candidatus Gottesmanbacteria bacterium]|nr:elongation factor 4 [Candidatus Gottesmanbacteria bacterium]